MIQALWERILSNYYLVSTVILGLTGVILFIFLPRQKKAKPQFYLPFLILVLVVFYEILAVNMIVNKPLNERIHYLLTSDPYKGWNSWVFNIFNYLLSKILFLLLIRVNLKNPTRRKIVHFLIGILILGGIVLTISGIEKIHEPQPIFYFISNITLIIASGFFFMDLISEDYFLSLNPVQFLPFWYISLILFQSALTLLADVAFEYLAFNRVDIYFLFNYTSMILYFLLSIVFNTLFYLGRNNFLKNSEI
ncbi:hypothetical protein SAMN04488519_10539 [Algoriphagus ornithinivorans]|uniref:Uncharacterized protein n=1 Tax=Algoriphagus ornithinivorans TaxID=226506 RepID=A0A1I5FT07_9BACT|nr:hypothetical protein SAMN04488519_10539 [Algoriphagus ornithinivorans]